ncbi:MAG: hypothetical protein HYX48_07925 [Chlamydiales bacterium]|nr:hypothetical protein [Chlamydiales bacterium]
MSDGVRLRYTSCDHLALHLALPNRVLGEGAYLCTTPGALAALLLRCNFAVRSESIGCSCVHTPPD